jgi:hypothetical protein
MKTDRVHFILGLEGMRVTLKKFEWMKNLFGVMHDNKWTMVQGLLDVVLGLSKRGSGFNVEIGVMAIS